MMIFLGVFKGCFHQHSNNSASVRLIVTILNTISLRIGRTSPSEQCPLSFAVRPVYASGCKQPLLDEGTVIRAQLGIGSIYQMYRSFAYAAERQEMTTTVKHFNWPQEVAGLGKNRIRTFNVFQILISTF